MTNIPVGRSIYRRGVNFVPSIACRNRYFEQNPVLNANDEFASMPARPSLNKMGEAGTGHVRFTFSEPGTFDDDLFTVSGLNLYRTTKFGVTFLIGQISLDPLGGVSMAATGNIGETPSYLFITDGGILWVYTENGSGIGHLQASGTIANNDQVVIGGVYYTYTTGSVDAGTPAGTAGNPWLLRRTGVTATDLTALYNAINSSGQPGVEYSTALVQHPTVASNAVTAADLYIVAREAGTAGNAIATTETGANLAWTSATLTGGGTDQLRQVGMPEGVGAISIDHYNSYVIVIPVQGRGVNGQFYWIEPGETSLDPLNFATAERSPDAINQVVSLSDRFWLFGQKSTETWVTTGNLDAPMQRMTGVLYEQGAVQGTAVRVGNMIIIVDENGDVWQIAGGVKQLSRPDISQIIREAIQFSQQMAFL